MYGKSLIAGEEEVKDPYESLFFTFLENDERILLPLGSLLSIQGFATCKST